eukprot:2111125-Rhodomonas_salina.4
MSGTDVGMLLPGARIRDSPFAMAVVYSTRHIPASVARGAGLTLSTAGQVQNRCYLLRARYEKPGIDYAEWYCQASTFTLLVRDRHGNACFDSRVEEAGTKCD